MNKHTPNTHTPNTSKAHPEHTATGKGMRDSQVLPGWEWRQGGNSALHRSDSHPQGQLQHFHTCPEGQAGVAAVDTTEGFAYKFHDAVDLGLDVSEADVGERVAVLVDVNGTCG